MIPSRAEEIAAALEEEFVEHGVQASSLEKIVQDFTALNRTFNRLIQGFMGLGLVVGIAALGVIAARSVVERRVQIGILRAIGYRSGMVQLSFLIESSFIALLGIAVGLGLGFGLSAGIIPRDRRGLRDRLVRHPVGDSCPRRRCRIRRVAADDVPPRAAGLTHLPCGSPPLRRIGRKTVSTAQLHKGKDGWAWTIDA